MRSPSVRSLVPILLLVAACNQINLKPFTHPDLKEVTTLKAQADKAYASEDWVTAEKAYTKLTQAVPTEAEYWFRLGNIYVRKDRPYDAITMYREALVRDPRHSRAWHNLGLTQLRIATNTFVEMQGYTDAADPVNQRAHRVVDAITRILEEDLGPAPAGTGGAAPQ